MRMILYAVLALLSVPCASWASPPQDNRGGAHQAQTSEQISNSLDSIASSLKEANEPKPEGRPCSEGANARDSDLCAQWKAADAAYYASEYGFWAVVVGWFGIALGTVTMGAAIAAAYFAHQAITETRRIGEAQVKAYFVIETVVARVESDAVTLTLTVRNCGQSPAFDVRADYIFYTPTMKGIHKSKARNTVGAQSSVTLAPERIEFDLAKGFMVLSVEVIPVGEDVFGKEVIEPGRFNGIMTDENWGKEIELHRAGMLASAVSAELAKRERMRKSQND